MCRHCFSTPEPKAELKERKNLVVLSLKSCAKKKSFRKSKGFLVKCSRGLKCTGFHIYIYIQCSARLEINAFNPCNGVNGETDPTFK